jgi:hypothetical protein
VGFKRVNKSFNGFWLKMGLTKKTLFSLFLLVKRNSCSLHKNHVVVDLKNIYTPTMSITANCFPLLYFLSSRHFDCPVSISVFKELQWNEMPAFVSDPALEGALSVRTVCGQPINK